MTRSHILGMDEALSKLALCDLCSISGTPVGDVASLDALTRQQLQREEAMAALDDALGYMFEQLRKQQLFDNTLIILTSDNRVEMGEHNLGQKEYAYNEGRSYKRPWRTL